MNASRKEHIAKAMYEAWCKRHPGPTFTWAEVVEKAPMLLTGWMEFAEEALKAIPWERDLTQLFAEAHEPEGEYFNQGLDRALEIIRAWRDAMVRGE